MSHYGVSRNEWCAKVATLCAPGLSDKGGAALAAMLSDLSEFSDRYFTAETARAVAKWPRKLAIPSYDELVAALRSYGSVYIHEPPRKMLPPPVDPPNRTPTEAEMASVHETVQEALRGIAEARAELNEREIAAGIRPERAQLRDVTASGQALMEIRLERFAFMIGEPEYGLAIEDVPEPYRSELMRRRVTA